MARPADRRRPDVPGLANRPPEPPEPATQQRAWAALTLGVIGLIGLYLSLADGLRRSVYVIILTLLIGALATWLGGSAIAHARRGGTARPRGAIAGTVLGGLGLALSAILLISFAIFWKELTAYSNCLSGANTLSAQQACLQQFSQSVSNQIRPMRPGG